MKRIAGRTTMATTTKRVTVFQCATQEQFSQNMMAFITGNYVPVEDMEPVVMLRERDADDRTILEDMFYKMNSQEYNYSLNYSMSVGDVVQIDKVYYRCMSTGWDTI
jgi:hypothetical protein